MTNAIDIKIEDGTLRVRVTGKLTKEFYEELVPVVEEQIKEQGMLRILFQMCDFHGWTAAALWEDIKFDLRNWNKIERLAIVGDSRWEKGMALFCKPFTSAKIRYFDQSELEAAQGWIVAKD